MALSPAASALAGTAPPFDAAKVAHIAQAIRDGKFTVDAGAIADKMIANAVDLVSRRLS